MKKFITLTLFLLLSLVSKADSAVEINGIYYTLMEKGQVAEVTSNPNGYTGDINIPETITYEGMEYKVISIDQKAFYQNSKLRTVTIPNSVTNISSRAFENCGITSINIPNSITRIEDDTFSGCEYLTSITIPENQYFLGYQG